MKETSAIHIVLLSGGSGVRLWPLSNSTRSKQFLKVLRSENGDRESMAQRVFRQIRNYSNEDTDITVVTGTSQIESLKMQLSGLYSTVIEPERRDTAPAILLASAFLKYRRMATDKDIVIVMPIDAFVDDRYYESLEKLEEAIERDEGELILLGVKPKYPSEKYGYIIPDSDFIQGKKSRISLPVRSFLEKPSMKLAEECIKQGALWNCGVFCFELGYALKILSHYGSFYSYDDVLTAYSQLPKNSFDYEVVEKADSVSVVPYEGEWKDLGTWNTLTEEMANAIEGKVVDSDLENVHIINETPFPIIASGLSDAIIAATPDGILVSSKEASVTLKDQVKLLGDIRPMYEKRQWGEYRVLENQTSKHNKVLVKELIIDEGKQISYQKHLLRSEYWIVTEGVGEVVIGENVSEVSAGSVVVVPVAEKHAIRAMKPLHIVEVQMGTKLTEDDIDRYGFYWSEL